MFRAWGFRASCLGLRAWGLELRALGTLESPVRTQLFHDPFASFGDYHTWRPDQGVSDTRPQP